METLSLTVILGGDVMAIIIRTLSGSWQLGAGSGQTGDHEQPITINDMDRNDYYERTIPTETDPCRSLDQELHYPIV
jgi:hypothetical protein